MDRKFQFLNVRITLCLLILLSCRAKDSADNQKIFEKASKSDSLSYYFPSILNDTFKTKNPIYKDFRQKRYSSSLYSLKQPIIFNKTSPQTFYRLLWFRSFHVPICFSMKEYNGDYFLKTQTLDREPAFYPTIEGKGVDENSGKEILDTVQKADRLALVTFDTLVIMKTSQWEQVETYLSKLDFWNISALDPYGDHATDGSTWVIEGRKNGKYHFVNRLEADADLLAFGRYLIKLGGLDIKEKDIY